MGKIIFVFGGARSGKSGFAIEKADALSKGRGRLVSYIATAGALDREMKKRIERHRIDRPSDWKTIEERTNVSGVLKRTKAPRLLIIDCMTVLVSNLLLGKTSDEKIFDEIRNICQGLKKKNFTGIIVSNEVGMGIVPGNALARRFRDMLGKANQMVAGYADEVYFLTAGIPIRVK